MFVKHLEQRPARQRALSEYSLNKHESRAAAKADVASFQTPCSSNKSNPLRNVVRRFLPPRPTCNYRSLKRINPELELDLTKFRSVKNKLRCQAVLAPLCWLSTASGRRGNCSWETLTLQPESTCRCLKGFIVRSVACIPVPFICLRMPNPREYTHVCVCVPLKIKTYKTENY